MLEITQFTQCPHFPCSFPEQSCRHCFCCLYPCRIKETGGTYITTKTGHRIWDCGGCEYMHMQSVIELLDIDPNEDDECKIQAAKDKLKSYLRGE